MTRKTSIEAYNTIKENGLLSKRRLEVYEALFEFGPCTGGELFRKANAKQKNIPNANIVTRLGELRRVGVVAEVGERKCAATGMNVIVWDVTDKLPLKLEKPIKSKCKTCNGKGYIVEQQARLF